MSNTITTAVAESTLLYTSVAVSVTVLAPISLQSKLVMSRNRLLMPQLSNELLSISVVVILAAPLVSK